MHHRPIIKFRPSLEQFEAKRLLSAGGAAAQVHAAALKDGSGASTDLGDNVHGGKARGPGGGTTGTGYLAYRITNPTYRIVHLVPPFQQVYVGHMQPTPGKVYNLIFIAVRNGTGKTFTASDGLTVRLPGFTGTHRVLDSAVPVLTGNQTWAPNQWVVFYGMGKQYYPLSPQVAGGFQLQAGGRSSTLVPGPSGIELRVKYDPATFAKSLDSIVAYGQGAQIGNGSAVGMPDTAINVLVSAGTKRIDFGGHF